MIVSALVLGVAACGDSDAGAAASGVGKEYAEALAHSLVEYEDWPLSEKEARCVASSIVDALGVDALEPWGTPDEVRTTSPDFEELNLDEDQAVKTYEAFDSCVRARDIFLRPLAADDSVTDEKFDCVSEALDDDVVRDTLVALFVGPEHFDENDPGDSVFRAVAPCMTDADR